MHEHKMDKIIDELDKFFGDLETQDPEVKKCILKAFLETGVILNNTVCNPKDIIEYILKCNDKSSNRNLSKWNKIAGG